jgi:hypothetical protein
VMVCTSDPHTPQCVMETSMSVSAHFLEGNLITEKSVHFLVSAYRERREVRRRMRRGQRRDVTIGYEWGRRPKKRRGLILERRGGKGGTQMYA